jgi:hypothetical protein
MSTKKTPKKKRARATDAELAVRVQDVLVARLNGAMHHDLRQFAIEKGWGDVSDRQLWRYMARADALLVKSLDKDRRNILARHIAQRRALYARSLQDGDYRVCLSILDSEANLLGLTTQRVELTGKDGGPVRVEAMSREDREAAIRNIIARVCRGGHPPHRERPGDTDRSLVGGPQPDLERRRLGAGPVAEGPLEFDPRPDASELQPSGG